ncbi:MAG: hypothetical protein M3N41_14765 [Acidobacteriota bacterium]|nr:hypothetical protein [Acidobacteriota bacterium]
MKSPAKCFPGAAGACRWWMAAALLAAPAVSLAQTDEIQVYDANIADKGKFNLMIHNNFTPEGRTIADFPGGVESKHALVGVAEWAYGVTDWFEQGLYLPLYSFSQNDGATFNGFKIRELFVRPHADERKFFYGVNFEFSVNRAQWDPRRYTSEVRPIVGWHLHPIDIIVNPIMDTSYAGGFKSLDFAPAVRVAYHFLPKWAGSIEEYADYGPFRQIYSAHEQWQQVWAVLNHEGKFVNIETGIGFGMTSATDRMTLKLMLSRDLN